MQAVRHAYIQAQASEKEEKFQHITLIEEAHRLLSKYMPGDSMNKKQGVEVFSDMLAEVRKYGESLIIVDQIPDKMTPEVLKNTNTKIVHKLFAQDDKEAIGNTMALKDEQKAFLSNLPPGRAIMFSQGWTKAIQVQVEEKNSTDQKEVNPAEIKKTAQSYYSEYDNYRRGILRGIEKLDKSDELFFTYLELSREGSEWLKIFHEFLKNGGAGDKDKSDDKNIFSNFVKAVHHSIMCYGAEMVYTYMYWNTYDKEDTAWEEQLKKIIDKISKSELEMKDINDNIVLLAR